MLLKQRSEQNLTCKAEDFLFGSSWIWIQLLTVILWSLATLSLSICVYSDAQGLALRNQPSWLMMRMNLCDVDELLRVWIWLNFHVLVCMGLFACSWLYTGCQRRHIGGNWHGYLCCVLCERQRQKVWLAVSGTNSRSTSPLFLWEWQAYTESCFSVKALSQQHSWLTANLLRNHFTPEVISLFCKKGLGTTFSSQFLFEGFIFQTLNCCLELTRLWNVNGA